MSVGRNEPCPCGSGRKYKNCHYAADRASGVAGSPTEKSPLHDVDNKLVIQIVAALAERFPADMREAAEALDSWDTPGELSASWLAWIEEFDGRTAADWYVESRGWSLAPSVSEWIASQRAASLSIWQVRDVAPGLVTLVDQLTGDERTIHDVAMSSAVEVEAYVLARIVDHRGLSLAAGMHVQPLPPLHGAAVVESVKRMLRRRKSVPRERLRNAKVAWKMLTEWTKTFEAHSQLPELRTSDGDEFFVTNERWTFDPSDRGAVVSRLAALEGAIVEPDRDEPERIVFIRERDETMVAKLELHDAGFEVETFSIPRADAIRARIEAACGTLVIRGLRSHEDPTANIRRMMEAEPFGDFDEPFSPNNITTSEDDETASIVRAMKERHYAKWLDKQIPALDGQTPREAARTAAGRRKLIPLLDGMAMLENGMPENERFDVRVLWAELNLDRNK